MIVKDYSKYDMFSKRFGLTPIEAFELELACYKRLSSYDNFPILINYDKKSFQLFLEDCGINLMSYFKSKKRFRKKNEIFAKLEVDIDSIQRQVETIIKTLNDNNIVHLDLSKPGKNLCFKNGSIYLIDFNIAVIDNNPLSKEINDLYDNFLNSGGYDNLEKKIKEDLLLFLD
jgi:tRNA A-37 threonylcarbamoyl transferase component Bud32